MKYCSKCETIKDVGEFSKRPERKRGLGLDSHCKSCVNEGHRRRRRDMPAEVKQSRQEANLEAGRVARAAGATKVCCYCRQIKLLVDFNWSSGNKDGTSSVCKTCAVDYNRQRKKNPEECLRLAKLRRARLLKLRYGLTEGEVSSIVGQQNNKCVICGETFGKGRERTYRIDHDHITGALRELLCSGCNLGLGSFKDSSELLRRAADYLEKHNKNQKPNKESIYDGNLIC